MPGIGFLNHRLSLWVMRCLIVTRQVTSLLDPFGSNVKAGSGVFPGEGCRHKGRSDPKKISDQQRSRVHGIFSLLNVGFRWKVWRKCSHPGIFQDIWFLLSWSLKGFRRKILKKLTSTMRVIFADGSHSVESDKLLGVKEVTWEYAYRNHDWAISLRDCHRQITKSIMSLQFLSFPYYLVSGPYFGPLTTQGSVASFPVKETIFSLDSCC